MKCPNDKAEMISCTIHYCPKCKKTYQGNSKVCKLIKKELDKLKNKDKKKS